MCQVLRTQYAVELETLPVAIATVKTGNECQHKDCKSIHGKKSIARKCCSKTGFSLCCCSTRCPQSLSSTRWLWYGLENEARETRRVSRNVTPHRLSAYLTRLVITARPWIAVCIEPWEWKQHCAPSMHWLRSILFVVAARVRHTVSIVTEPTLRPWIQNSNPLHWHQTSTRRHVDQKKFHTWRMEQSSSFVQYQPIQLHLLHQELQIH